MIRVFPIAAPTTLTNSFGYARSGGRAHQGNDLFANEGSPLVAVDDGQIRSGVDPLGGNIVNLYGADGARHYYAHLSAFALPDGSATGSTPGPRTVRAGDVVGFLGHTGNAVGTQPHLHFETHPGNGAAVDPYPALVAAPRVTPNQRPGAPPSALVTALVVGLGAAAIWSLLNPLEARRLAERMW